MRSLGRSIDRIGTKAKEAAALGIPCIALFPNTPEELRTAMRSLGYRTQNDLAQAIGVSRSAVSLWLEGKVGVPRPVAMLLRMLVNAQRRVY